MASAKYGRLFTESDVLKMLEQAYESGYESGSGVGEDNLGPIPRDFIDQADRDGSVTFPADEPLFLLRAKDLAAPDAIADGPLCYEDECQIRGASRDYLDAVHERAREMRRWQAANQDRVKVPD